MSLLLALALQTVALPQGIEAWRADIEREFKVKVPIVWADVELRGDSEGFELVRRQLSQDDFRRQFSLMQAAMISERTDGVDRFVILVNLGSQDSWRGFEEALLGHELGHLWLRARRLPTPAYRGGQLGCVAVHTGDIVQHILIRAEMDRRGIDHRTFFMLNLDAAARGMEQSPQAADACAWARQAAIWVDARLAFQGRPWPGRSRYEGAAGRRYEEAGAAASRIVSMLEGKDLDVPLIHRQALAEVYGELQQLARKQQDSQGQ
jgi:hypothetical protein